jgi:hypothetical protein
MRQFINLFEGPTLASDEIEALKPYLRPAVKVDGKLRVGKGGETHNMIVTQFYGIDPEDIKNNEHIERGFYDLRSKKFYSGEELRSNEELPRLDSTDLMSRAQRFRNFGNESRQYTRFIGDSINEAIDWTQDLLRTTRPIAESVLFSLLADKTAAETEDGYLLTEDDDEEIKKRGARLNQHRPRFRFGRKRSNSMIKKMPQHTHGYDAAVDDMLDNMTIESVHETDDETISKKKNKRKIKKKSDAIF